MNGLQPVKGTMLKYSHLVGTGGIGSGMFFKLEGNHTLGRNESRLGELVPFKDYCKLHIIAHYVAMLLSAGDGSGRFAVIPLGRVGDDEAGKRLVDEMRQAGMDTRAVSISPDDSTLFSVCFQYPDKTGCNVTTSDSACSRMEPRDVDAFFARFDGRGGDEMILAAPEVPLSTRARLLEIGKERGGFTAASVLSSEVPEFIRLGMVENVDLLAVNIDEAAAIAGISQEANTGPAIAEACLRVLEAIRPGILLAVTDGPYGCYGCCDGQIEYFRSLKVEAIGTAGAGDAFLAGVLCGICCGLPFLSGRSGTRVSGMRPPDGEPADDALCSAIEFGNLLAGASVTSPDSIHHGIHAGFLRDFVQQRGIALSPDFSRVLGLPAAETKPD